jgi:hypothetical protein
MEYDEVLGRALDVGGVGVSDSFGLDGEVDRLGIRLSISHFCISVSFYVLVFGISFD